MSFLIQPQVQAQAVQVNNINNILRDTQECRMFLSKYFYNADILNQFAQIIISNIDIFNIEVSPENNSIRVKVKKTNLKKNNINIPFTHDSTYYYQLITPLYQLLLTNNSYTLSSLYTEHKQNYSHILSNEQLLYMVYNIVTQSDGYIVIYL